MHVRPSIPERRGFLNPAAQKLRPVRVTNEGREMDDEEMEKRVTRKLHWHIMSRFVLLTVLNHMDRANLVSNLD